MSATVDIRTRSVRDVLSVPIQAVTTRTKTELEEQASDRKRKENGEEVAESEEESSESKDEDAIELVFVIEAGKAIVKQVKTGIQDNEFIEIVSGVEETDEVVTAPYRAISKKLGPGDDVEVVSKDALYKAEEATD
jgi:HlyD family secretion protein